MTGQEIIDRVKTLNLPEGTYVVFGSCPLALAGIREAKDIDLLVSKEIFEQLKTSGWKTIDKGPEDKPITSDVFEAHHNWEFEGYKSTLAQLLETASIADGIPFVSLEEVRKWKAASDNPKHLADVKQIDSFLAK